MNKFQFLCLALAVSAMACGLPSAASAEADSKVNNKFAVMQGWRQALLEGRKQLALEHLEVAQSCFESALREAKRVKAAPLDIATCYRALAEVQVRQQIVEEANPNYKRALKILKKDEQENFALVADTYGNLGDIALGDYEFKKAKKLYYAGLKVLTDGSHRDSYLYISLEHRYGKTLYKLEDYNNASKVYYNTISRLMRYQNLPNQNLLIDVLADYIDLFRNTQDQGAIRVSSVDRELLKDSPDTFTKGKGVPASSFSKVIAARLADQAVANSETAWVTKDATKSSTQPANPAPNSALNPIPNPIPNPAPNTSSILLANPASATLPSNIAQSLTQNESLNLPNSSIVPDRQLHDIALNSQVEQQRVDFYERMVSVDINALGPNHPSVARDLSSLATVYLAANNLQEAKPLLQRALVIYQKTYGDKSAVTERTATLLSVISEEQRARDAGEQPSDEFVARLPIIPVVAQTPEVAVRLNYLALQCLSYRKYDQAYALYSWALAATARVSGPTGMLTACCLNDYARVLRACDQEAIATQLESDAAAIVRANIVKKAAAKNI